MKETKITKTQTKSRDMKVILQEGFTYKAEFLIKEEAYFKLLSVAKTFGNDNALAILDLCLNGNVHNIRDFDKYDRLLKNSTISFETHFPSNFVAIIICVTDSEVEVDSNHDTYEEVKTTLDRVFRLRVDILDFIRSELYEIGTEDEEEE